MPTPRITPSYFLWSMLVLLCFIRISFTWQQPISTRYRTARAEPLYLWSWISGWFYEHSWLSIIMNPTRSVEVSTSLTILQFSSSTSATLSRILPRRLHLGVQLFPRTKALRTRINWSSRAHETSSLIAKPTTGWTTRKSLWLLSKPRTLLIWSTQVTSSLMWICTRRNRSFCTRYSEIIYFTTRPSWLLNSNRRPRTLPLFGSWYARPTMNPSPLRWMEMLF